MTTQYLPTLPARWQVAPAKAVFGERRELAGEGDLHLTPSQHHGVLTQDEYMLRTGNRVVQVIEGGDNMKHVLPDDFIIHLRSFQGGIERSRTTGKVSPAYTVLTPRPGAAASYFRWVLKSDAYVQELRTTTNQLRDGQSIKFANFAQVPLPLPPLDEQRAIADYLDRETTQIDTLIAKQQQLIAALRERRVSVIASALDGGGGNSSNDGRTKPTDQRQHASRWPMIPARHLCRITTGGEDSGNAVADGQYPFYVRGREVLRIDQYSFDGEAVLTPGDGQGGTGKVYHYVNGRFEAHQRVYVFTDFRGVTGWYFYYYLSTFLGPVALAGANTVTMESLRRPVLADFKIAVPPLDEQLRLTKHLDEAAGQIDTLIAKAEQFIELSKERRAALVTAAVTGQIDVTGRAS